MTDLPPASLPPAPPLDQRRARWLIAAGLVIVAAFAFPLGLNVQGTPDLMLLAYLFVVAAFLIAIGWTRRLEGARLWVALALVALGMVALTALLHQEGLNGHVGFGLRDGAGAFRPHADVGAPAFWLRAVGLWLGAWMLVEELAARGGGRGPGSRIVAIAVPVLFGAVLFVIWEWLTVGFGVPMVLMPSPSAIGRAFGAAAASGILAADFVQTFVKAVLTGWVLGSAIGFAVAVLADAVPFLRRGLLPLGNVVSALPIIGVAPIMVMWFGFDWPSKVAVVVLMTVFPMLVNAVVGLEAAGHLERDLMRSYGAGYWSTLLRLRLPAAMPFLFNALKINSTLALIGAIVAEFFGTPIVGMGFRISTEVGRMALDTVWAEIAVAAVAGSAFYGLIALAERAVTFWHPSYRHA